MASEHHFTYFDYIIPANNYAGENIQKFLVVLITMAIFVLAGLKVSKKIKASNLSKEIVIPKKKPNLFYIFDLFMERFVKYHDSLIGKEGRKHIPFTATVFFFILAGNLIGLIPGMPAFTTTVWINVAMAIVVFIYFNYYGIKEHGVIGYLKHFAGPIWWLAWLIFPIEIISTCFRILTLNLRLYWNITADHVVLSTFTDMLYPPLASIFYGLGLFVSFMQAFVFATLAIVYILLAVEHEEEH